MGSAWEQEAAANIGHLIRTRSASTMCNDFEQHILWADYVALMQAIELGTPTQQTELDLPQVADVRITDMASVPADDGAGLMLHRMSFGFPPFGKGGPIFNFQSEGRSFAISKRAVTRRTNTDPT